MGQRISKTASNTVIPD
jgi:hypothetical protein